MPHRSAPQWCFHSLSTALLEIFLPGILKALNTPEETYDMAYGYLAIYVLGYFAVYLYLYFTAVLRSFGNSMFQAAAMLVSTILNAVLDPIFIHFIGFHGAAIATSAFSGDLSAVYADLSEKEKAVQV